MYHISTKCNLQSVIGKSKEQVYKYTHHTIHDLENLRGNYRYQILYNF